MEKGFKIYSDLFKSEAIVALTSLESKGEKMSYILIGGAETAIKLMTKGKVLGKAGITSELLQTGGL